jgi:hypothetical protein
MGINWWQTDPYLSTKGKKAQVGGENRMLKERVDRLEKGIKAK